MRYGLCCQAQGKWSALSLHVVCCGDQCKYSLTVLSNAALVSPTQGRGQAAWEWSGDLG